MSNIERHSVRDLTIPEHRAFKAFNEHASPGSVGQLLAALDAYCDALKEFRYLRSDPREMAPDIFVDIRERMALGELP